MTAMSKDRPREAVTAALLLRQVEAQRKLDAPYEKALGKLAIRFSLLHFLLEQFTWEIWRLDKDLGMILTKDLRVTHLAEKLCASAEHVILRRDDRRAFLSILNKVKKAANERNELLHSLWIITEGEPVFCISRKRGRLVGPDAPSADQINDLSKTILEIIGDFDDFKERRPLRPLRGSFGFGLDLEPEKGE
jgi:hypothetical protein